jgi:hypothetical protein
MFDDAFIDNLPDDPDQAALFMCERFREIDSNILELEEADYYYEYAEAFGAMEAFLDILALPLSVPSLGNIKVANIRIIRNFYNEVREQIDKKSISLKVSHVSEKFKKRFGGMFFYQLSDGDLKRIQILINELRDLTTNSEIFDANHKERILRKLENLQMELHKKMSSLDKLWGLIGEAGVALGKFGKDAKPFVDRIKEIAQITWRTQARSEELPSGTTLPLLSHEEPECKE